jgi:SAM-dependent methyltransferase
MINYKTVLYRQASDFTSFHKKLGVLLAPYLDRQWDMADIGCGLALLDFEIAAHVKSITAIDIDANLIEEVRKEIDDIWRPHKNVETIVPVVADSRNLGDAEWDVVMTCFYNVPFTELDDLLARARKRAILIVHGRKPNGRYDPLAEEAEKRTADSLEAYLTQRNFTFKKVVAELPFGLPFKTIEDIHRFLHSFAAPENAAPYLRASVSDRDAEQYMLSEEERIVKTNRYDFPYYLPKSLNIAAFIVAK